jgi:hypothetical protein
VTWKVPRQRGMDAGWTRDGRLELLGNSGYIGKDREDVFLFWKNANSNGKFIISAPF